MMAVMAGIVGGTIGIRMIYVDEGYRKIIERIKDQKMNESLSDGLNEELANMTNNKDDNRRGIIMDGIIMGGIILVEFITALGIIPNLTVSVIIASFLFIISTLHFQHHARKVSKNLP